MKKSILIAIIVLVIVVLISSWFFYYMLRAAPGNIFKNTLEGCDEVGYGYKGTCYGNIAVKNNNISICYKIPEEEIQNRNNCFDYFNDSNSTHA